VSIGRNATYNLIGFLVPTVLSLATVPAYLSLIGAERYGVLALAWLILGYFGLFDLGLGRATSQRIASLKDATPAERITAVDTAIITNVGIGIIGGAILWPVAWYVFGHSIDLSPELRAETLQAVPLLALAVPVATSLGVLTGALVGRERFLVTNRISVTSTALFQLFPLAVAWWHGPNLAELIIASLAARMVGLVMLWRACRKEFGPINGSHWSRAQLGGLLAFGGWVTLTSMSGPILAFSDRFFIGSLIGAVAVTIYTVPMEAMRRISGIATALANALFPRLALAPREEADRIAGMGIGTLYALLTPPVAAGLVLMDFVMRLWLGDEIGAQSAVIGRVFIIAYWFNVFAQIPYTRLQASGRPDVVTKIMLAELLPYLGLLYFALLEFGLVGAVYVFLVRVVIDTLLMYRFSDLRFAHMRLICATLVLFELVDILLRRLPQPGVLAQLALAAAFAAVMAVPSYMVMPANVRDKVFQMLRLSRR
jgi:O-antigen/teichoic acid export membrane protein